MDIGDPIRRIENVPLEIPMVIPLSPGEWPLAEPQKTPVEVPTRIEEPVTV